VIRSGDLEPIATLIRRIVERLDPEEIWRESPPRAGSDCDRENREAIVIDFVAHEDRPAAAQKHELANRSWGELRQDSLGVPIGRRAKSLEVPQRTKRDPIGSIVTTSDPAQIVLDLYRVDRTHDQLFARSLMTVA